MGFRWPCSAHLWTPAKCWLMPGDQEKSKSPHRHVYLVTDHRDHSRHGYDTINRCNEQSLWELDKGQLWPVSAGHLQCLITISTARYESQHLQQQMPKTWPRETSRAVRLLCVRSKGHSESPPGIIMPSLSSPQSHWPPQPTGVDQGQCQRLHWTCIMVHTQISWTQRTNWT